MNRKDAGFAFGSNPPYRVYYNRGNARLDAGDKDGAIADLRQAVKLNPALKQVTERLQEVKTKP